MITGKELANRRKAASISQQKLADLIGVTNSYLSNVEAGKRPVSEKLLVRISDYINIHEDQITGEALDSWNRLTIDMVPEHKKKDFIELKPAVDRLIKQMLG